jgi:hypothetical protein
VIHNTVARLVIDKKLGVSVFGTASNIFTVADTSFQHRNHQSQHHELFSNHKICSIGDISVPIYCHNGYVEDVRAL